MTTPIGLVSPVNDKQLGIRDIPSEIQTALKNQCINFNINLLGLVNEHAVELNKISGDKNLSDVGKMTKRTALFDEYNGMVAKIGEEARLWSARAENFRAQIRRDEVLLMPSTTDPAAEARAREIRSLFRKIDPAERVRLYSDAMDSNDFETMAAVERSPRSFPLLEAPVLARFIEDRRQKSHPSQTADAQSLDLAGEWLAAVCQVARQRLSR